MGSTSRQVSLNQPEVFSDICGEHTLKENSEPVSDLVKRAYPGYLGVHLKDQDNYWAPYLGKEEVPKVRSINDLEGTKKPSQ